MRRKRLASPRRLVAQVHSWAGAIAFAFVFLISLSGVLSGLAAEMFHWQYGDVVAPPSPEKGAPYADIDEIIRTASDGYGGDFQLQALLMDDTRFEIGAAMVFGVTPSEHGDPSAVALMTDPYRADYLGAIDIDTSWASYVIHFHDSLLLGEGGGVTIAIVGLLMIAFVFTGLYQWLPLNGRVWRKATRLHLRGNARAKMFHLHSLIGFWLALPVLLFTFTGVYLSKPAWFGDVFEVSSFEETPPWDNNPVKACSGNTVSPSAAAELAEAAFPDRRLALLSPPRGDNRSYFLRLKGAGDANKLYGDAAAWVHADCPGRLHTVVMDPNARQTFGAMIHSLHSGRTFGAFGLPLIILTGIGLALLSAAGVFVWWKQTFRNVLK